MSGVTQAAAPARDWKRELVDRYFPGTPTVLDEQVRQAPGRHDKTVIHIAARCGSKRLEDKNIRPLGGVPLIAYSILMARGMGADRVIVNTNSSRYARIAESYGAEVPFLRPEALAADDVSPGVASYYAQKWLLGQGYPLKNWVELYPTSPFRNLGIMREYMAAFRLSGSLQTVFLPRSPLGTVCDGVPLGMDGAMRGHGDGRIYYKRLGNMQASSLDFYDLKWRHCAIISNPVELIDIDTDDDFRLAEEVIDRDAYDFGVRIC